MGNRMRVRKPRAPKHGPKTTHKRKRGDRTLQNFSKTAWFRAVRFDESKRYTNGMLVAYDSSRKDVINSTIHQRIYGDNLPDYRARIRRGENATTSANNYGFEFKSLGGYKWRFIRRVQSGPNLNVFESYFDGTYFPTGLSLIPPNDVPAFLDDTAKSNFIRKAKKAQSSMMGGEFLHDISKTIASFIRVKHIFMRALRSNSEKLITLREQILFGPKGGRRDARIRDANRGIAENWLEWNYGIAPTVSDLQDAAFGIWRAYDRSRYGVDRKRVNGWAESISLGSALADLSLQNSIGDGYPVVRATLQQSTLFHVSYYGDVKTLTDGQGLGNNIAQELGFGLRDFIPTIWECIPYSFLVDYFTNFGQIITAWTFPRSDVLWINRMIRIQKRSVVTFEPIHSGSLVGQVDASVFFTSPAEIMTTRYARNIFAGSLTPTFRWHFPFRDTDWLNILALITQRYHSHLPADYKP